MSLFVGKTLGCGAYKVGAYKKSAYCIMYFNVSICTLTSPGREKKLFPSSIHNVPHPSCTAQRRICRSA